MCAGLQPGNCCDMSQFVHLMSKSCKIWTIRDACSLYLLTHACTLTRTLHCFSQYLYFMTNLFLLSTNAYLIIHLPCLHWAKSRNIGVTYTSWAFDTSTRNTTSLVCSCPGSRILDSWRNFYKHAAWKTNKTFDHQTPKHRRGNIKSSTRANIWSQKQWPYDVVS